MQAPTWKGCSFPCNQCGRLEAACQRSPASVACSACAHLQEIHSHVGLGHALAGAVLCISLLRNQDLQCPPPVTAVTYFWWAPTLQKHSKAAPATLARGGCAERGARSIFPFERGRQEEPQGGLQLLLLHLQKCPRRGYGGLSGRLLCHPPSSTLGKAEEENR